MVVQLSPHFSLAELTVTLHRSIDNTAPSAIVPALINTAKRMEQVRSILGDRTISVSSGYRCPDLNKAVGGTPTSAHVHGHAVDFNCYGFGTPYDVCRALIVEPDLDFDQIIYEGSWVHISFDPRMRRQLLTLNLHGGYSPGIVKRT